MARGDGVLSKKLLQAGATFEGRALRKAVQAGHTATVDLLVEHGASVQEEGDEYGTPLHVAAEADQLEIARLLLANVDYVDGSNNSPLTLALGHGNLGMAELLLNAGADLTARGTEFDLSALDFAGSGDAVRLLVKHGAEVSASSSSGHTALHTAAHHYSVDPVHALVEAGADLEAGDMKDKKPLHYAAGESYAGTINPPSCPRALEVGRRG